MFRPPLELFALALLALLPACSRSTEPRRDLVLVILPAPGPDGRVPAELSALRQAATVHRGPQRHADLPAPSPAEQRVSMLTGTRRESTLEALRQGSHTLMWIAQRSGRQARAVTTPTGLSAAAGFDDFRTPTNDHGLEVRADAAGVLATWQAWQAELAESQAERPRALIVLDFGAEQVAAAALAASLSDLDARLGPTDIVFAFTDPASADRAWLIGKPFEANVVQAPFDPREFFQVLLEAGRIQLPSTGGSMRPGD